MADPWQKKYRRERAKRIARILGQLDVPPIEGGQGRTPLDVHRDAIGVLFGLALVVLVVVLLVAEALSR